MQFIGLSRNIWLLPKPNASDGATSVQVYQTSTGTHGYCGQKGQIAN